MSARAREVWGVEPAAPERKKIVSTDELERRLNAFLADQDEARRRGATLETVKLSVDHVASWTKEHEQKDDGRHKELVSWLESLEKARAADDVARGIAGERMTRLASDVEALQKVQDETEQRELEDVKERHKATMTRVWQIVIYTITALLGLAIAYAAGRAGVAH